MSEEQVPYYTGPQKPVARKRKPRSVSYGPGRYTPASNGRGYDCVICKDYGRVRARLPDEQSARAWIDAQDTALKISRPPLTRAQMLDAQDAIALLPVGGTLLAAVKMYADARRVPSVPLKQAVQRFLEDRRHGAIDLTVRGYRHALTRLCKVCGEDCAVSSVTSEQVSKMLGYRQGVTRNNILRHLATFFRWAVHHEFCTGNPALALRKARVTEPSRGILTVSQVTALMKLAVEKKPALVPYLALGFFSGIRPAELERLDPARIGKAWITIDGKVAKTSDHRTVPVRANLRAWLYAYPPKNPIPPLSAKHLYAAIRALRAKTLELEDEASRVKEWPMDCMRHSYASYAYELTHDAGLVASEMGHRGTDIFFRHYRGLVQPGDGKKFFAIKPVKDKKGSALKANV